MDQGAIVASGMGWQAAAAVLLLAFVFSHDLYASTTAHISAMMLAFMTVGAQLLPAEYLIPFPLMARPGRSCSATGKAL